MADLIDKQTALEIAMCYCPDDDGSCSKAGHDIREMLDEIEALPAVNRWIPVEDALPEIGYSVLVTRQTESNTRYIRTASRQDDCWMDDTDKYGNPNPHQVIAWMPLPDAYKPPEKE